MKSRVFAEFENYDTAEYAAAVVKNSIDINRITISGAPEDEERTSAFSAIPVFGSAASAVGVVTSPEFSDGVNYPTTNDLKSVYVCIKADEGQAKRAAAMLRNLGALSVKVASVPV